MNARQWNHDQDVGMGIGFEEPERFAHELALAAARVDAGVPHALLVVKLNHMAEVLRECGSDAETALLQVLGHTLQQQMGSGASASRLEPDRLAILQPNCLPRDARALGKRVRTALEGGKFLCKGLCFRLGAYVGVLEMTDHCVPPADQVAKASRASDVAESLGGDGVVVTSGRPEEQVALEREREWRDHLSRVI